DRQRCGGVRLGSEAGQSSRPAGAGFSNHTTSVARPKDQPRFAFSEAVFRQVTGPCHVGELRASALRFGDDWVQALLNVLLVLRLLLLRRYRRDQGAWPQADWLQNRL